MKKEELMSAKFILWKDYGYGGWSPEPFNTLKEAVESEKYSSGWVITRGPLEYEVSPLKENN